MVDVVKEADVDFGIVAGSVSFTSQGGTAVFLKDVEDIDIGDDVETVKIKTADSLRIRALIVIGRENEISIKGRVLSELQKIKFEQIGWLSYKTYGKGGKAGVNTCYNALVKCSQDALGGSAKREVAEYECKVEVIGSGNPDVPEFYSTTGGKRIIATGDAVVDNIIEIPNGSTVNFSVALGGVPDNAITTITVANSEGDDTIEVSAPSDGDLTFTQENWTQLQTCTLITATGEIGDMADITIASADDEYDTKVLTAKIVSA